MTQVYNGIVCDATTLDKLCEHSRGLLQRRRPQLAHSNSVIRQLHQPRRPRPRLAQPETCAARDLRSLAIIGGPERLGRAQLLLGYDPTHRIAEGVECAMP